MGKSKSITSAPAKITRPHLRGVLPRLRLFHQLDQGRKRSLIWVTGPPGAGKTTLVSSYLDARKRRSLWYQIDAGDADVATFFHYLGLAAKHAAPRYRKPLPHLTSARMNAPDRPLAVRYADVAAAAERLAGHAHRTPVLTSRTVNERTGAEVFFRCENFQRSVFSLCIADAAKGAWRRACERPPFQRPLR